ncbi:MAG: ABC transporter substrate-binding protein [Candidatus Heimdallarchaeota archaeon]
MKTIFTKKSLGLFKTFLFLVMLCNFSSIILMNGQDVLAADEPDILFNITLLSPNTIWSPFINQPIVDSLPNIGINVTLVYENWAGIAPRTYGWSSSDPIPTYSEGGFDIVTVGYSFGMDFDYNDIYNPNQIPPLGNNYYSYNNTEMNWAMANYTSQYTYTGRQPYLDEIQRIMYDDLPAISILNDRAFYPYDSDLTGWDGALWHEYGQPMESWEMAADLDFYYAMSNDVDSFSIHHVTQNSDNYWLRQIYNGLADRENGTGKLIPRFASSYSTTDGITWTIHIDPDTKWADGTNFTADDVVYNYQLVTDAAYNSVDYFEYSNNLNPANVVKVDNYTVDITFNALHYLNEKLLTLELIPKHIWDGVAPADIATTATSWAVSNPERLFGLGPYQLNNYETMPDTIINLERNLYFTNLSKFDEPSFDEVHFTYYGAREDALSDYIIGDMDMLDSYFYFTEAEVAPAGQTTELVKTFGFDEMSVNHNHPYIGTGELCPIAGAASARHIRKAISHMIPRETIISNGFSSRAVPGIIPMGEAQAGFNNSLTFYEYNLTKALWHMRQAGVPESYTTVPTGLTINTVIGLTILFGFCIGLFTKKKNK